jgi:valyl-tRNA synthetase
MDDNGVINSYGGKYEGQDRFEARVNIVSDLEKQGLLVKIKEHNHNVGTCYRCDTVVEPIASKHGLLKWRLYG